MIRIEDIEEIPRYAWLETSSKEFAMMPYESHRVLMDMSSPVKLITKNDRPLLIAGLFRRSFFSIPYLWTLLTTEFKYAPPSTIRAVVKILNKYAPQCETLVELGNARAERLAKTFGFEPMDGVTLVSDIEYRLYRRG